MNRTPIGPSSYIATHAHSRRRCRELEAGATNTSGPRGWVFTRICDLAVVLYRQEQSPRLDFWAPR